MKSDTPWIFLIVLIAPILILPELKASEASYAKAPYAEASYARASYARAMTKLKLAKGEQNRWYALGDAAKESLNQRHDSDARSFAEELERLTPRFKKDWNYGNAIQNFNIVLGRLALKSGNVEEARNRLLAAGHSPGGPQMDTFGANMTLANELLAKGEKAVVLEYFKLCRKFWEMHDGKLDVWAKDVRDGGAPDFGANLNY